MSTLASPRPMKGDNAHAKGGDRVKWRGLSNPSRPIVLVIWAFHLNSGTGCDISPNITLALSR
jgi:hypothetical protein